MYGGEPPLATIVQPAYACPWVPPGQEVVTIDRGPPLAVTATWAVAVVEPEEPVAVRVYVVVEVGLTVVEPLAEVDVKLPGAIAMLVAPVTTQLRVELEPDVTLGGLAAKELIEGLPGAFTVTVNVEVVEPVALVAVNV